MSVRKRLLIFALLAAAFAAADCRITDAYVEYRASEIKTGVAQKPSVKPSPAKPQPQRPLKIDICLPDNPCMHRLTKVV